MEEGPQVAGRRGEGVGGGRGAAALVRVDDGRQQEEGGLADTSVFDGRPRQSAKHTGRRAVKCGEVQGLTVWRPRGG